MRLKESINKKRKGIKHDVWTFADETFNYMKNRTSIFLAVAFVITMFFSCSKSDGTDNSGDALFAPVGNWGVTLYFDNTDQTSNYAGYIFTFDNNGQVVAMRGTNTIRGLWSGTSSKFKLNFTDALLGELNDEWQIVELTTTKIRLKDSDPAQDDRLEFTRN
jgi:hypothetical protein